MYCFLTQKPSCILDDGEGKFKLYLGNIRHATDVPVIQELGIMFVLNTAYSERDVNKDIYGPQRNFLGVSMDDDCTYDISKDFIQCIEFIKTAKKEQKPILIHCMAGVSRSATVTIAYIMQQHKMSLKDAASFVFEKRPIIFPNVGFIRHLMEFEKKL